MSSQVEIRIAAIEAAMSAFEKLMDERDRRYSQRAAGQDDSVKVALLTSKEAVAKAESATEKRFESVNEFRKTLSDQATDFLSRKEYEATHRAMGERIISLSDRLNKAETESVTRSKGVSLIGSIVLGVITATAYITGMVIAFWKH